MQIHAKRQRASKAWLSRESLAAVLKKRVLNNPYFCWTFYLNIYFSNSAKMAEANSERIVNELNQPSFNKVSGPMIG